MIARLLRTLLVVWLATAGVAFAQGSGPGSHIPGPRGPAGPPGAMGPAGATWYSGVGAPSSGMGANGDYYLRTDGTQIYAKAGGTWSITVQLPSYPAKPGEFGVVDATFPWGHAYRYGMTCDGVTDYEATGKFDIWKANATLPGVKGILPGCFWNSGVSLRSTFSNASFYFEPAGPGGGLKGIWHQIANGGSGIGQAAQASCTLSGGAIATYALQSATVTINIGTGVVTWSGSAPAAGTAVVLTTTGALPTGSTSGQTYFTVNVSGSTAQLATAPSGSAIVLSGSQSGTHTATLRGAGYFNAPQAIATVAGSGGNMLRGVNNSVTMEADAVDMFIGGAGYAVADTITSQNGVVFTVTSIGAAGVITGLAITTRGAMSDPTANTYANRYFQASTSGHGSGFYALVYFRLASVTNTSAGSGGGSNTCVATIRPPTLNNVRVYGEISSYGRLGVQNPVDNYIERFHGLSNAAIAGARSCGVHITSPDNLQIDDIEQDDAGNSSGFCGWAAVTIDSVTGFSTRATRIKRINVKKADFIGVAICAEAVIDEIRVGSYGAIGSNIASSYCGTASNTTASGVYVARGYGTIGSIRVDNNDATIGASAQYGVLVASTGFANLGYSFENNLAPLAVTTDLGLTIGNVVVTNASRKGAFVLGDRDNPDTIGQSVTVSGRLQVQPSMSTAQTSGYALVANNNAGGNTGQNLLSELAVGHLEFLNTGASLLNVAPPSQPDAFFADTATLNRIGLMRLPNHGVGTNGLFIDKGRFIGTIDMDQQSGAGLPGSTVSPLLQFYGSGTAGSDVKLYANSGSGILNTSAGALVQFDGTAQVRLSGVVSGYRVGNIVFTQNTNTDLQLAGLNMTGPTGTGFALRLGGTLNRFVLRDTYITGYDTGLMPSGSPTCTGCIADNVQFGTQTTANNTLAAGFFATALNLGGASKLPGPLGLASYTVATLPASPGTGAMAYVTDAMICSYGGGLSGSGSNFCKVVYNGSAWVGN